MKINRAPVLTLWAKVVAEQLGYSEDEALALGKAVAGYTAQFKGRSLGIYVPKETADNRKEKDFPDYPRQRYTHLCRGSTLFLFLGFYDKFATV